ncbi:hypothetical protein G7075_19205 [Phycicoccus sp. HDW14]|uniref:hypothetical protein n=1 Tax=Phycicoccus sp. HDW14 TaxID=2714941 RepID=UPI00140DB4C8|nr:hypothetical protein [Phycicoccus sp. HDW14]QIM22772.1 hypothetical protein G7075_19205 [Phycicoccus sp. HDW14]
MRFELYLSLLVGVAHALLLITVFGGLGLWLVSPFLGHALVASGAGTARTWHTGTGFTALWLVPSVVLVVTSGTALLMRGLRGRADDSPRRDRNRCPDLGEDGPGRGARASVGVPFAEALRGWLVTLSGWAVGWLLLVPGSVLLAIGLQEVSSALPTALTDHAEGLRAALTGGALTSVLALVASTWKGLWRPRGADSFTGAVLSAFRRVVAPRLALAILLVVLLSAAGEVLTGLVASSGSGSAWWGTRSLVVPILALLGFVATSSLGPNATSMFPFYRAQLQYAYLDTTQTSAAVPRVVSRNPGLATLPGRALRPDIPALHLLGTVNSADADLVPTGRHGIPFVFSRDTVGVTSLGAAGRPVLTTPERLGRERRTMATRGAGGVPVTLSEAMAVSAAAVAPMAGREAGVRAYRVLFALLNVRLGVWLPNPAWAQLPRETTPWRRLLRWTEWRTSFPKGGVPLAEAVGAASAFASWLYVTDGGHFDNLGLVEALRDVRAARSPGSQDAPDVVIVLDGSGDQEDAFPTMGRAVATARMELGVEVRFDPRWMTRGTASHPDRVWSVATAHRSDAPADEQPFCTIVYLKCVLPREVPWDLRTYAASHDGFPATSSSLEVYDEFDFEAFRRLGVAVVDAAASEGAFATLDATGDEHRDDTGGRLR